MTTATTPNTTTQTYTPDNYGTVFRFENVNEPGAYICQWNGHLLRVPEDGVAAGRSPMINIVGTEPLYVTKISDNPWITLTKARMMGANYDLNVNF
ncbi:MAG: hypothetical protein KAY37_05470 [Phycisphaerae bacterium]|nr:hypothetical protein [Phycisphaerae bacterium]